MLKTPPPSMTRPTQERVRQAVFNMMMHSIEGALFADIYAGSGAVGLEALSRGAAHVYFLERQTRAVNILKENIALLGCHDNVTILKGDAKRMAHNLPQCDLVFCDPPYGSESDDLLFLNKLPAETLLKEDGHLFYETTHAFSGDALIDFSLQESRKFGDTTINILTRK